MPGHIKPYITAADSPYQSKLLSIILENNNELIVLIDADYKIIYRSPSATRITGWPDEVMMNQPYAKIPFFPDDKELFVSAFNEAMHNPGKTISVNFRITHKDGQTLYMDGRLCNLLQDEQVGAVVFNVRDVSSHKESEELIAKSELKYRSLVERISDGFISLDTAWRFTYANNVAEQFLGKTSDELLGKIIWKVFPNAERGTFYKAYHEAMATQKNVYLEAFSYALNFPVQVNAYPSPTGLNVFFRDIREEKKAKEEKQQSEERYRELVERISDGFIAVDNNFTFVYANKKAGKMFGHPAEYFPGKNLWEVFPNSVNGPFYKAYHQSMTTQEHVRFENYSTYAKMWFEVNVYPSPSGLSIYFKDITERIEAEAVASSSEAIRHSIMGSALDAIICMDDDGRISFWNKQAETLFGFTQEEVLGQPLETTILPERYKQLHKAGHEKYKATGEGPIMNRLIEMSAVNKAGHEFPVELFIVEIQDHKEPFFCAFIRDITERKEKEKELLLINKRLQQAQEIAHVGGVEINFLNNTSLWSDETLRIYGLEQGKNNITADEWLSYIHPDDLAYATEIVSRMPSEKQFSFFHRIVRPNGEVRYILSASKSDPDEQNQPGYLYAVVHDITEIKELELELQKQKEEEQLRITAAIIDAQERERNAIGEELHDNINQILTGVSLQLSRIDQSQPETKMIVEMAVRYLKEAINENRKIARELVVPDFESLSLVNLLTDLTAYMFNDEQVRTLLVTEQFDETTISNDQKLAVYRVMQEQFTNIIKYAKAHTVTITLATANKLFKMTIADDGIGMNEKQLSNGIGLRNIKSRISLLNGSMQVHTSPGKGFMLEINFPVKYH